ncbi:hypothetical protein MMC24_007381 [Lignoscripta atroalba]|nr:hypothetical protein [Lignoscripta atroalba]
MEKATLPGPTITIHDGPGFDLNANQGPRVLSISLALIALSGIAVTLRFLSRLLSKAGLWWDDWVVLGALFISWGPCICMIVAVRYGFGKHIEVAGPNPNIAASRWFKILYVFEVFYTAALAVTKYSIMLFYWRIFKTPHFKAALITIAVLVTAWFIAIGVAGITECLPVSDLWEVFLTGRPGRRISLSKFFLGSAIPNIITDWTLLVMPLPLVWRLRIPNSQKIGLTTIFLLGGFVCVVSIVRLVVLDRLEQVDVTWNFVDAAIWSAIEPTIGIPIQDRIETKRQRRYNIIRDDFAAAEAAPKGRSDFHAAEHNIFT